MSTRIKRPAPYPPPRRVNRAGIFGCGCLSAVLVCALVAVLAVIVLRPTLANVALSVVGAQPAGQTDDLFNGVILPPTVQVINTTIPPTAVVVDLGSYGQQAVGLADVPATVAVGSDGGGSPVATVSFTEDALLQLCRQRSQVCNGSDPRYQNVRFDLRPGGAIVYADVSVPVASGIQVTQTAWIILQLDASQRQFNVAGVDVGGTYYNSLPSNLGDMSALTAEVERTGNDILNQMTVEAGSGRYTLQQVQITDSLLTLVMAG